jgi:D-lactate dehydrogenase
MAKTVGVVGTGSIGKVFCEIMLGFGCKVLAFDLIANKELEGRGVEYLPFLDLLEKSDIISLHCPLTELTRHLINADTIRMMKRGGDADQYQPRGIGQRPGSYRRIESRGVWRIWE